MQRIFFNHVLFHHVLNGIVQRDPGTGYAGCACAAISLDCDVLQADGGTRTASISGAWVALHDAIQYMMKQNMIKKDPLHHQIASVSVGIYEGTPILDLDYAEDSNAETDMNVVMNGNDSFIEVQGTAEGHAFNADELNAMLALARKGISNILQAQQDAIKS